MRSPRPCHRPPVIVSDKPTARPKAWICCPYKGSIFWMVFSLNGRIGVHNGRVGVHSGRVGVCLCHTGSRIAAKLREDCGDGTWRPGGPPAINSCGDRGRGIVAAYSLACPRRNAGQGIIPPPSLPRLGCCSGVGGGRKTPAAAPTHAVAGIGPASRNRYSTKSGARPIQGRYCISSKHLVNILPLSVESIRGGNRFSREH